MECDLRAGLARLAGRFQLRGGRALFVRLLPDFPIAPYFEIEPIGKCVDHGNPDAVQASRNFVRVAIEFASRVQNGHHNFGGRLLFRGVHIYRDAAPIVRNGDAVVLMHYDVDFIAEARHCFVDRVIDDFPHEMVQTHFAGRADVHRRTFADGFEAAQDFYGSSVVLVSSRTRPFSGRSFLVTHGSCIPQDSSKQTKLYSRRKIANRSSGRRSSRRARHSPCPLAPCYPGKSDSRPSWDSKGFSKPHPVPFRSPGGTRRSCSFSPAERGRSIRLLARASWRSFWQELPLDQQA